MTKTSFVYKDFYCQLINDVYECRKLSGKGNFTFNAFKTKSQTKIKITEMTNKHPELKQKFKQ